MAKSDLIGGALWEQYSQVVNDRMNNPAHRGEISEEEAAKLGAKLIVADWGAEACGDAVRLYWAVDPKTDIILKSSFKSFGCGTVIASSETMAEMCMRRRCRCARAAACPSRQSRTPGPRCQFAGNKLAGDGRKLSDGYLAGVGEPASVECEALASRPGDSSWLGVHGCRQCRSERVQFAGCRAMPQPPVQ